jgi:hypothetical protein
MEMPSKVTDNAIKLVGEYFAPGASLLIDGKILPGTAHLVAGLLLRSAIGPIGYGLVIANSYASSITGRNLLKQFAKKNTEKTAADKPAVAEVVEAVPAA